MVYAPLAFAFLSLCLICGLFLVARAIKTRLYHIIYLSAYFLLTFIYFILSFITYIETTSLWWPRVAIYQVAGVTNLIFIQKVFFGKSRSPFKHIMMIVIVLAVFNFITAVVRDTFDGQFLDLVVGRVLLTIGGSTELVIITGWQSRVSFSEYKKYKGIKIEPHVRARYLLFGTSGILLMIFGVIDVPATIISLVVAYDYYIIETISIIIILVYSILNFLTWVMPSRFKKFLNRNHGAPENEADISEEEIMKQLQEAKDKNTGE